MAMYSLKDRICWVIEIMQDRAKVSALEALIEFEKDPSPKNYRHIEIILQSYQEQEDRRRKIEAQAQSDKDSAPDWEEIVIAIERAKIAGEFGPGPHAEQMRRFHHYR